MRSAVVCPGPSLAKADHRAIQAHTLVVCVNRAALSVPCDVWAACDADTYLDHRQRALVRAGRLTWVCHEDQCKRVLDDRGVGDDHPLPTRAMEFRYNPLLICDDGRAVTWPTYTKTSAMIYAAWAGATEITVYGDDMAGYRDFDGHVDTKNVRRDDDRWAEERRITECVVRRLTGDGVTVKWAQTNDLE